MENLENIEEVNKDKFEEEDLPKGGFEVRNIQDNKKEKDFLVNNTGIAPGEAPSIKEGTDADAASG
jgi:hypothetical protein